MPYSELTVQTDHRNRLRTGPITFLYLSGSLPHSQALPAGLGRRNTGLPPHLLEATAQRKLARDGASTNHSSANGRTPAKHDILDSQPDVHGHAPGAHGTLDCQAGYNNVHGHKGILEVQKGVLDSHAGFLDGKHASADAGASGTGGELLHGLFRLDWQLHAA